MVVAYFTNFAKTGDPNGVTDLGQQLPTWPQTRGSDPSRPAEDLVLRVAGADEGDITVLNEYHGEACEYWCALPHDILLRCCAIGLNRLHQAERMGAMGS